jgi:hypothetical protein
MQNKSSSESRMQVIKTGPFALFSARQFVSLAQQTTFLKKRRFVAQDPKDSKDPKNPKNSKNPY